MRIFTFAATLLCVSGILFANERKPIAPPGSTVVGPYTPAILTGEYLYVSGQLGRLPSGAMAPTIEEQTRIVLNQIKTLVEAAGLTMDHVVYTHLFLTNIRNYDAVNKIYATYFPNAKPARVTFGVARLPSAGGVEINAVAVRNLAAKLPVARSGPNPVSAVPITEALRTTDRLFLSGTLGRDADTGVVPKAVPDQIRMALRRAKATLRLANLTEQSLVSLTVYHTAAVKRDALAKVWAKEFGSRVKAPVSYIEVNELALGSNIGVTGVAALNRKQAMFGKGCAGVGETLYCAVEESGLGPIEQQTRDTIGRLSSNAKRLGFSMDDASTMQLYLENMDDFDKMNAAYSSALHEPRPARATVQPAPSKNRRLIQASAVVSRSSSAPLGRRKSK